MHTFAGESASIETCRVYTSLNLPAVALSYQRKAWHIKIDHHHHHHDIYYDLLYSICIGLARWQVVNAINVYDLYHDMLIECYRFRRIYL
jgi:hypothetical protein